MNTKYLFSSLTAISIVSFSPIARTQTNPLSTRIPVADSSQIGTQVLQTTNNNFTITGGVNLGQNLLHSFTDFSVPTGGGATFDNSLGKQSIITRVTGGNFSDIDGLVNTQGANFFLLNPNGIVFGTNAQLNVGQTFVGSTANGIDLVDGGGNSVNFLTNQSKDAQLLTINPNALFNVSRLNMGGGNGQITNFGILQTANPNQYIGLIGGNVTMNGGQINAPGGRVDLGGLSSAGTVALGVEGNNFRAQFPNNVARGDVSLTNQAGVNVAGAGAGDIAITARNLEILGSFVSGGIFPGLGTPEAVAGDIKLNTTGEIAVANGSISNDVNLNSKGNGGNIIVDTGSFSLRDGAALSALTGGTGNAGNITVMAKDNVSLSNTGRILSTVEAGGVGKGGTIDIKAGSLSLKDGGQLGASTRGKSDTQQAGQGDAGNIKVKVTGAVDIAGKKDIFSSGIFSSVDTGTKGNGGNITIDAGSVSLRDGNLLFASTIGTGNAGNVTVIAKDAVSLSGGSILSTVEAGGVGNGGSIDIKAGSLSLKDGGSLATITRGKSDTQPAGQGDAGNIKVKVIGAVDIAGKKDVFPSGMISEVNTGTKGNGGNITVDAGSVSLQDGALLSASTIGTGNAGNVTVIAKDTVSLSNGVIRSTVEAGGIGNGGTIDIKADSVSLKDGGSLATITRGKFDTQPAGQGNAGNITVKVNGAVDIAGTNDDMFRSGIFSFVDTGTQGNGGNITIDAGSFSLREDAQFEASTYGVGNAGNITLVAKSAVSLNGTSMFSAVETGGAGNGGSIDIKAGSLSLKDGAQLTTVTRGKGNSGNITINANKQLLVDGSNGIFGSGIFANVEDTGIGKGGNIKIDTESFSVTNAAVVISSSRGQGDAGNIQINASDFAGITGNNPNTGYSSGVFTFTQPNSTGTGGNITVNADTLRVSQGGVIDARTRNNRQGGEITVKANVVELLNGGEIVTTTAGSGFAGKIDINASKQVVIKGIDNTFNDRVKKIGKDPFININPASGFFVSSTGTGRAGDIQVSSPQFSLDNGGKINAESLFGDGGNINLAKANLLLLRRGAQISTNASGTNQQGSNGGNITITAPNGFIVTAPNENSDISANGFSGSGGKVDIDTRQNFWISPLSRAEVEKRLGTTEPSELNPASLSTNDITAISQVNPSLSERVSITPPQIDITAGLSSLPNSVTDPTNQINPNCSAKAIANNSFTNVGRGGIPATPKDPLNEQEIATNWVRINPQDTRSLAPLAATPAPATQAYTSAEGKPIVEAQAWRRERNGDIVLVAGSSLRILPRQGQSPSGCVGQ